MKHENFNVFSLIKEKNHKVKEKKCIKSITLMRFFSNCFTSFSKKHTNIDCIEWSTFISERKLQQLINSLKLNKTYRASS
jgi:hypothetical protein